MKNFILILLVSILLTSCTSKKDQFAVKGTITGADSVMIFLQKPGVDGWGWEKLDSAKVINGQFTFIGLVEMPVVWYLHIQGKQVELPVFMENVEMDVQIYPDSIDKSNVSGSPSHDIYKHWQVMENNLMRKWEEAESKLKSSMEADETIMIKKDSLDKAFEDEWKSQLTSFVKLHNKSVVAPYLANTYGFLFEPHELEQIVSLIDTTLNASEYLQDVKKQLERLRGVAIGRFAPDFTINDSTGNPVTLSFLKGKILLVDFWASWCGPCRAENPNIVRAWQTYHKKGFDVLGVSMDYNRDQWIRAIKKDNLTWTHVSDLKGWGSQVRKLYGVSVIPSNVLLDRDHKIIARNLSGNKLLKKLEELLGQTPVAKSNNNKK